MSREHDEDAPSKTQRKREAEALQALGEELAQLPADVLATLGLPDRLCQALEDLNTIPTHEAQRRHRQFIGRLMRDVDPAPLQAFIEARKRPSREAARLFRISERWRDRMLEEGEPALRTFLAACPGVDADALEETLQAARQGRAGAPKRLFRMVRTIVEERAASGAALLE
jgi:ribosome-associated protein